MRRLDCSRASWLWAGFGVSKIPRQRIVFTYINLKVCGRVKLLFISLIIYHYQLVTLIGNSNQLHSELFPPPAHHIVGNLFFCCGNITPSLNLKILTTTKTLAEDLWVCLGSSAGIPLCHTPWDETAPKSSILLPHLLLISSPSSGGETDASRDIYPMEM